MTSFQDQPPQSRRALRQERAQSQEIDDSAAADVRPSGRRARAAAAGDDTQITGDLPALVEPGTAEQAAAESSPVEPSPVELSPAEAVDVAELPNATRAAHDDESVDAPAVGDRSDEAAELPDSAVPKAFPFAGQVESTSDDAGHPGFRLRDFSPELSTSHAEAQSADDWSPTTTGESAPLDYQTQGGPGLGYVSPYAEPDATPSASDSEQHEVADEPSFDSLFSDLLAPDAEPDAESRAAESGAADAEPTAADEPATDGSDAETVSDTATGHGAEASAAVPVGDPIVVAEPVAPVEPVVLAQEERTMSRREWRAMRAKAEAEEAALAATADPASAAPAATDEASEPSVATEQSPAEPVSDLDALFRQPEQEAAEDPTHGSAQQSAPASGAIPPLVEPQAAPHTPLSDAMAEFEALTRGGQSTVDTGSPSQFPSLFAEPASASTTQTTGGRGASGSDDNAPVGSARSPQTTGQTPPPVDASPFSAPAEPDIVRSAPTVSQPSAAEQAAPDESAAQESAPEQSAPDQPAAAPREPFSFLLSPTSTSGTTDTGSYAPPVGHWSRQAELDDESQPFENTLSRDVGGGNVATTTNALVLPMIPQRDDFSSVLNATGEIMVTGTINLPGSVGSTGRDSRHYDDPEVDHLFDQFDAEVANTGSAPVRAITAVSSHTATRGGIETPRKQSNRMLNVLLVTACVMAVAVAGLLIAGFVFKIF